MFNYIEHADSLYQLELTARDVSNTGTQINLLVYWLMYRMHIVYASKNKILTLIKFGIISWFITYGMLEPIDKTRISFNFLKGWDLSPVEHHLKRRSDAEDSEFSDILSVPLKRPHRTNNNVQTVRIHP
jgi:hypothetical protein